MSAPPIPFIWQGDSFVPAPRFAKLCDEHFVIGEAYLLTEHQERLSVSHRAYFASVRTAWENLSEEQTKHFPSETHLRKYALIRTGFADHRVMAADSPEAAQQIAAFARPIDPYSVIRVEDCSVSIWTAWSQDYEHMDKEKFAASKRAVLDWLSRLIGVSVESLKQNSKEAA